MADLMQGNNALAGGCFLTLAIPIGFVIGMSRGDPLGGSLLGLLAGSAIAIVIWLLDRRRRSGDSAP